MTLTQTSQGQLHGASVSVPPSVSYRDTLSLKVINLKKKREYKVHQLDGLRQVTSEEKLWECIFNAVGKDVRYDLDFEAGYTLSGLLECVRWSDGEVPQAAS